MIAEGGVEETIGQLQVQRRAGILQAGVDALPAGGAGIAEIAKAVDPGRDEQDVVIG